MSRSIVAVVTGMGSSFGIVHRGEAAGLIA